MVERISAARTCSFVGGFSRGGGSVRAGTVTASVASACAHNRVAIAVPCHRVVRGDGSLGGYRWGLPLKEKLLQRERAA